MERCITLVVFLGMVMCAFLISSRLGPDVVASSSCSPFWHQSLCLVRFVGLLVAICFGCSCVFGCRKLRNTPSSSISILE